jgi:hypothetical protein
MNGKKFYACHNEEVAEEIGLKYFKVNSFCIFGICKGFKRNS